MGAGRAYNALVFATPMHIGILFNLISTLESYLVALGRQNYELLPFRVAVFTRLVHGRFHPLCPSEHHRRAARDANAVSPW